MNNSLTLVLAQINLTVGDIEANTDRVMATARQAVGQYGADLVLFPELTLCGYPPEDLLLRSDLFEHIDRALKRICLEITDTTLVLGLPYRHQGCTYNGAVVISNGRMVVRYAKQELPNYSVFDEKRYFTAGEGSGLFTLKGCRFALSICEDIWNPHVAAQAAAAGAEVLLNLNASPFHECKLIERIEVVQQRALENNLSILYTNLIGGQDEVVFDGGSFAVNHYGELVAQLPQWHEAELPVQLQLRDNSWQLNGSAIEFQVSPERALANIYQALVMGVRDYIEKNGFPGVLIGLSGGIDSALTLAIAVDALGAERVHGVGLPSRYSALMSLEDARLQAEWAGVKFSTIPIEASFSAMLESLSGEFKGVDADTTEENIQARCRGVLLMALSNKSGKMVLTTGNKSEMAVGYATLYGDMCGGFAALKDVPKTMVYRLAQYVNQNGEVIPQRVIYRPPSAELAPDQQDSDSLPPYEVLDDILYRYIEKDESPAMIEALGHVPADVRRVVRLVEVNEYKRRQAAPGVKITRRAFGRDRRFPITSGFGRQHQ